MGLHSAVDAQAVARHHNLVLSSWAPRVHTAQASLACDELLGRILALAGEVLVLGHPVRRVKAASAPEWPIGWRHLFARLQPSPLAPDLHRTMGQDLVDPAPP